VRRVLLVIEELGDPRFMVTRVIDAAWLDTVAHPEDILLAEYHVAKKEIAAAIDKVRTAGPKGPLP
jgi:hypothetical protein